ncbi:MAG: APC family permease [Candidatus Thorarchaeota archaeon]
MSTTTQKRQEEKEQVSLVRTLGFWGSFGMGFADIGADIFLALGVVVAWAMGAAPLAFLIASILYACTGLSYTELASTYPIAGGGSVYARKAFGDIAGFIAGWGLLLDYTICIPLFALIAIGYLGFFFPTIIFAHILIGFFPISVMGLIAAILVVFLIFLNYLGIRESANLNIIFVSICLVGLGLLLGIGFFTVWNWAFLLGQIQWGVTPTLSSFLYSISVATVSFIGLESISEAAEETKNPGKTITRSTLALIVCIIFFTVVVSLLALGVVPWPLIAEGTANPLAVVASYLPWAFILAPFIAIIGVTISYVSANSGIVGVSRVSYEMSRSKLIPQWFNKLHPKYRTPYRSIILFSAIGVGLAFLGDLNLLVDLYAFGALISYIMVNLALIQLRNTQPNIQRAWRVPGTISIPWRKGKKIEVPLPAAIGVISCFAVWLIVVSFKEFGRLAGFVWFLIGFLVYVIYRKSRGLSLRTLKPT